MHGQYLLASFSDLQIQMLYLQDPDMPCIRPLQDNITKNNNNYIHVTHCKNIAVSFDLMTALVDHTNLPVCMLVMSSIDTTP
jgi:hypothetical protein